MEQHSTAIPATSRRKIPKKIRTPKILLPCLLIQPMGNTGILQHWRGMLSARGYEPVTKRLDRKTLAASSLVRRCFAVIWLRQGQEPEAKEKPLLRLCLLWRGFAASGSLSPQPFSDDTPSSNVLIPPAGQLQITVFLFRMVVTGTGQRGYITPLAGFLLFLAASGDSIPLVDLNNRHGWRIKQPQVAIDKGNSPRIPARWFAYHRACPFAGAWIGGQRKAPVARSFVRAVLRPSIRPSSFDLGITS